VYLALRLLILPVGEQESLGWRNMIDDIMDHSLANMLSGVDLEDPSAAQTGAAGCRGYQTACAEGKRIMDDFAEVWVDAYLNGIVTSVVVPPTAAHGKSTPSEEVSESDIGTMIEQGIGLPDLTDDDAITTSVGDALDGAMWAFGIGQGPACSLFNYRSGGEHLRRGSVGFTCCHRCIRRHRRDILGAVPCEQGDICRNTGRAGVRHAKSHGVDQRA